MTVAPASGVTLGGIRTRTVPLIYPAELSDGTVISEVTVRRMLPAEVTEFIAAAAEGKDARLPMFDQPPEILDALDPDDFDALNAVALEMLPRRLKRAFEAAERAEPAPTQTDAPAAASPVDQHS